MIADGTPFRLLVRHFVRRFVDNDLVSAHADRHESLAFFAATLIAAGMFGAVLIGSKYLFYVPSASWVAVSAMYDMSTIVPVCMIVVALTTIAQWDALALDTRDAAVLGPLPVGYRTIVRAKATANAMFGAAVVAGAAIPASAVFSFFLLASLRLPISTELRVLTSHVVTTTLAAAYAFVAVLAVRETLRLFTGAGGFARISPVVQVLAVVTLTTLLLLVLGGNSTITRMWRDASASGESASLLATPPLWFVGLAQALNGESIALAPIGGIVMDDDLSRFYLSRRSLFLRLSMISVAATAFTLLLACAAFFWNSRRLPSAAGRGRPPGRMLWDALSTLAAGTLVRNPVAQATFFFTLRVIYRSGPHRLTLAVGAAVAVSLALGVISGAGLERGPAGLRTLSLWSLQPLVLIALAATLRHAMALPAELRANWIFHQCWAGQLNQAIAGARRAAFVAVMLPAVLIMIPVHAYALGAGAALFHAANGVLLSAILLTLAMIDRTAPPFLTSYVRTGNVSTLGPILVLIALTVSIGIATAERVAFETRIGLVRHTLVMAALVLAIRFVASGRLSTGSVLTTDTPDPSPDPLRLSG